MRAALLLVPLLVGCGDKGSDHTGDPITTGAPAGTPAGTPTGSTGTAAVACPEGGSGPELETTTACYRGRTADGAEAFLGIRYAEPPVGDLRWARPVPYARQSDPVDALTIGSVCPQTNGTVDFELRPGDGEEDCLFLNVVRPEGTTSTDRRPILFFVHGGGHIDGHGGAQAHLGASFFRDPSDPPAFAEAPALVNEQGAIVVTVNYRLAQLGWLAHPGLTAESGDGGSGNQGMWDVLSALQWVNDNAVALGGDPDHILLFGESAGSVTTCALLTSPLAEGLFDAALMQSGVCSYVQTGLDSGPLFTETAHDQGARLAEALGCATAGDEAAVLACMRAAPEATLMATLPGQWGSLDVDAEAYGPVVDGVLLPSPPSDRIEAGLIADVPVVLGVNADEGTLFTTFAPIGSEATFDTALAAVALVYGWPAAELQDLYDPATRYGGDLQAAYAAFYGDIAFVCPTRQVADALSAHTPVRTYFWTHTNPITSFLGAHHGVEISYAFGTGLDLGEQATMIDIATEAWASVAAGTPRVGTVDPWPLYAGGTAPGGTWVELAATPSVLAEGPRRAECDWMDAQPGW